MMLKMVKFSVCDSWRTIHTRSPEPAAGSEEEAAGEQADMPAADAPEEFPASFETVE